MELKGKRQRGMKVESGDGKVQKNYKDRSFDKYRVGGEVDRVW